MKVDWIVTLLNVLTFGQFGPVATLVGELTKGVAAQADKVVSMLPDASGFSVTIPSGFIYGYTFFNTFLPVSEVLTFLQILVGVALALFVFRVALIVYHVIPKPFMGT